jgi:predicted transcriptional regulator
MAENDTSLQELSRREREVLGIVFRLEQATVNQVMEEMPEPPTRAALRSIFRILEDKGHLRHAKVGREFVYRSTQKKDRAGKQALSGVLKTFFDGSLGKAVVAHLAERGERISDSEAAKLESLIEELSQRQSKSVPEQTKKPKKS